MNLAIESFLRDLHEEAPQSPHRIDLVRRLLLRVVEMAEFDPDDREMVVAAEVLDELLSASEMFARWRERPKLTIFGSARTSPNSPLYGLAHDIARQMAERGWMTINGAGGGIMEAAAAGAGFASALGVNIELPFEQQPSPYIDAETRLVVMKYFFTRKAALTRPAAAFVVMPGGFGTMDELFEVLTLIHTGKTEPAPVILVDTPEGSYWHHWRSFIEEEFVGASYLAEGDLDLVTETHSVDETVDVVVNFFRNYRSFDVDGDFALINLQHAPSAFQLEELANKLPFFNRLTGYERVSDTALRIPFDRRDFVMVRRLIDACNEL